MNQFRVPSSEFRVQAPTRNPKPETRNLHAVRSQLRGQALLELAVFGSFLLLVLGALINYGLNTENTQWALMKSFRDALSRASGGSASVTVVRDRYIPNPSSPFAVGSPVPVSASASVTKDFALHDHQGGSPTLTLDINGTVKDFTIADSTKAGGLGLQPDSTRQSAMTTTLDRTESPSGVTAASRVQRQDRVTRTVLTGRDASGHVTSETITTMPKDEDKTTTWTTPWN